jgi:DNA invertase Pin-like site-specific DNA recombinase
VTVWKLDRLGRSLPHLIETVSGLEARGVSFRSLTEAIDITTSGGRLIFHVFGALGQFERDLIRERTRAGLDAAMARGRRADAVLFHRKPHTDTPRMWAKKLIEKKPFKLVAVALANKMARIACAIKRGETTYREIPA